MTRQSLWSLGGFGALAAFVALAATLGATPREDPKDRADEQVKQTDTPREAPKAEPTDPAVERARAEVKMLDALYKNSVVSITLRYPKGAPAIKVAMDVFKAMEAAGHHSAKLVDATGSPLGANSEPETPFEERAAEAMRDGKDYIDEVVGEGADRRLLAASLVPAVLDRCAACHGVEKGDLLGFIRYDVPVR